MFSSESLHTCRTCTLSSSKCSIIEIKACLRFTWSSWFIIFCLWQMWHSFENNEKAEIRILVCYFSKLVVVFSIN